MNRESLIIPIAVIGILIVVGTSMKMSPSTPATPTEANEVLLVDKLFNLIKKDRLAIGVSPVYLDYEWSKIAQNQSDGQYKVFGDAYGERLYKKLSESDITFEQEVEKTQLGIGSLGSDYVRFLAIGISVEGIYEAFMKDEVYRNGILEDGQKKIGIGVSSRGGLLYVVIIKERLKLSGK